MSENANDEVQQFLGLYNELQNAENHFEQTQMQCLAKSMAMQQAGVIEMDSNPDRIWEAIKRMDTASLR